ncbi:MAG TPA: aldose 1-epimerase family protein [Micromonosporaceae bacterium]|jgi:aldose 1-epimerase
MRHASGEQWTISAAGHEAVVVEIGGGLRTYTVDAVPLIDGYDADELRPGSAGSVLVPWPNRIRDGRYTFRGTAYRLPLSEPDRHNAIHGLVEWTRWHATKSAPDAVTVEYELPPQPGYPWALALTATYQVGASGLRADHTVTNVDSTPCPFGFAVHPYLLAGAPVPEVLLRVPARSRLLLDGRLLPIGAARVAGTEYDFTTPKPIGALELDVAFGDLIRDGEAPTDAPSEVALSTSDGGGVAIWAGAGFGWWQVFTGDTLAGERRRRAVAVEPMTCPPDAFRSGRDLITLEPDQSWHGAWGIRPAS